MHIARALSAAVATTEAVVIKQPFVKAVAATFGFLFITNSVEMMLISLLFTLDLLTGTLAAIKNNKFQSREFFKGCTKMLVYAIFIMLAIGTDYCVSIHLLGMQETMHVFLSVTFSFIILTDVFSVFENLEALGYMTPKKVFIKLLTTFKK